MARGTPGRGRVRALRAGHARGGVRRAPDRALRALAPGRAPRTPAQLRRPAPGETGGDTGAPETKNNPDPAGVVPHRLGGRPHRRLAGFAGPGRAVVLLDVVPRPHHPWDPRPPSCTVSPWQDLDLPPATPAPTTRSGPSSPASRPLAGLLGRPLLRTWRAARPPSCPSRLTDDQHPRGQRQGPRHERAHRRGLRPGDRRHRRLGAGSGHRHRVHHRPRRAPGRLRPALQGPVPHRRPDAAARSSGGRHRVAGRRRRPWCTTRWARSTWRRPSAPSPGSSRRAWMQGRPLPATDGEAGRESACCASGTASSPATACTCAPSTATAGSARCTSPRPPGNPTASRRCGATTCSRRARWSTSRPAPGPGGVAVATGELYDVENDPLLNGTTNGMTPVCAAPRRPHGRSLPQPSRRGAPPQGGGAGLSSVRQGREDRLTKRCRRLDHRVVAHAAEPDDGRIRPSRHEGVDHGRDGDGVVQPQTMCNGDGSVSMAPVKRAWCWRRPPRCSG